MAENKTKLTDASVAAYFAAIESDARRKDCESLSHLMSKVTKQPPKMWGTSIVGFGKRTYPLSGGRVGEICTVGFSSRKGDISVYGVAGENADQSVVERLGKYTRGKGCLYIAKLSDVDAKILEKLVAQAMKRQAG